MIDPSPANPQTSQSPTGRKASPAASTMQLLKFRVGTLNLALPIQSVFKVATYGSVHGSGLSHFGITQIDGLEVTVIDLHRRVFGRPQTEQPATKPCLLIVQDRDREFYGLVAAETPTLIDAPLSMIRVLPEAYRRSDTLDMASHVAVIPQDGQKLTVFLLDIELLLKNPSRH